MSRLLNERLQTPEKRKLVDLSSSTGNHSHHPLASPSLLTETSDLLLSASSSIATDAASVSTHQPPFISREALACVKVQRIAPFTTEQALFLDQGLSNDMRTESVVARCCDVYIKACMPALSERVLLR